MKIPAQLIGELFGALQARDRAPAGLVLVKAMEDADLMAALWNGERVWMMLPDVSPNDPAGSSTILSMATAPSLKHLFGVESPDAPSSAKEETFGPVRLLWVDQLPGVPQVAMPAPSKIPAQAPPVTPDTVDWKPVRARNLAGLTSPAVRRAVLDPARRPYLDELIHAFGQELDPAGIAFFAPTREQILSVERRFVEAIGDDLSSGGFKVVHRDRLYGFQQAYATFEHYERQAVGWSVGSARYVYLRFRRPGSVDSPLEDEYLVMDGGHAFFELQCQVPMLSLFNVRMNGEA